MTKELTLKKIDLSKSTLAEVGLKKHAGLKCYHPDIKENTLYLIKINNSIHLGRFQLTELDELTLWDGWRNGTYLNATYDAIGPLKWDAIYEIVE